MGLKIAHMIPMVAVPVISGLALCEASYLTFNFGRYCLSLSVCSQNTHGYKLNRTVCSTLFGKK